MLQALDAAQYTTPTPIQAQAIPEVMAGRDIIGMADTGTGKTAAFSLPILHRFSEDGRRARAGTCRALVLCPTRELAVQIADSMRVYSGRYRPRVAIIVGGMAYGPQTRNLRSGVEVLVATPGRLEDHMKAGNIRLDETEILVADEADRMLDLGFLPAIRRIAQVLPADRQNLFFSATMPDSVRKLADGLLRDPMHIAVAQESPALDRIEQQVIAAESKEKGDVLVELLRDHTEDLTLVFTRTKRGADRLVQRLGASSIRAEAMHGNKSQAQRQRTLVGFRAGRTKVLVATDLAARGIDIDDIRLVVNYDLPNVAETYVHRIGRTARAGATGRAVSLCSREERPHLIGIERLIKCRIPKLTGPGGTVIEVTEPVEDENRRRQSARPEQPAKRRRKGHRGQRPSSNRHADGGQAEARNTGGRDTGGRAAEARGGDNRNADHRQADSRLADNRSGNSRGAEARHANKRAAGGERAGGKAGGQTAKDGHALQSMPFLRRRPADGADKTAAPARKRRRGNNKNERQVAVAS